MSVAVAAGKGLGFYAVYCYVCCNYCCLLFLCLVATSNRYCPKCSARQVAASFPLGSISACRRSKTERTSPDLSLAEVPPIDAAFLET
jgi:hypothetical protein